VRRPKFLRYLDQSMLETIWMKDTITQRLLLALESQTPKEQYLRHYFIAKFVDIMNFEGLVTRLPAYNVREPLLVRIFQHRV
jgi:hypothetical protein